MTSPIPRLLATCALLLATSGCALFSASGPQQLEVHAFLDGREVAGVGCMLANDGGRWYVVAPGRVTVERSRGPLSVDCLREGAGTTAEQAQSPAERAHLAGHLLVPAEGGLFPDGRVGAGFAYPATLNVDLRAPAVADPQPAAGNRIF